MLYSFLRVSLLRDVENLRLTLETTFRHVPTFLGGDCSAVDVGSSAGSAPGSFGLRGAAGDGAAGLGVGADLAGGRATSALGAARVAAARVAAAPRDAGADLGDSRAAAAGAAAGSAGLGLAALLLGCGCAGRAVLLCATGRGDLFPAAGSTFGAGGAPGGGWRASELGLARGFGGGAGGAVLRGPAGGLADAAGGLADAAGG